MAVVSADECLNKFGNVESDAKLRTKEEEEEGGWGGGGGATK